MSILAVEITGHLILMLCFLIALIHIIMNRGRLQRNLRSSRILFWTTVNSSIAFSVFNGFHLAVLIFQGTGSGISPWIDLVSEYPLIIAQTLIIGYLVMNKIVVPRSVKPMRILAIGAHPDDLEIAVGATLAKLHDAGHLVSGLVATRGERGGNELLRPGEAQKGAGFLGLDHLYVYDFCDTRLSEDEVPLIQVIEAQIRELKPDIIFTHSVNDIHQDHQAVHEATLRAARNKSTVLCYESPSTTQAFQPNLFVDVSDYVGVKISAIKLHWDQRNKPYMREEQIRGKLAFRGGQARLDYAEGFEVIRMSFDLMGVN